MKTIKIEDVLYHGKGVQMVRDAGAIYKISLKLSYTISEEMKKNQNLGKNSARC